MRLLDSRKHKQGAYQMRKLNESLHHLYFLIVPVDQGCKTGLLKVSVSGQRLG